MIDEREIPVEVVAYFMGRFKVKGIVFPFPGDVEIETGA